MQYYSIKLFEASSNNKLKNIEKLIVSGVDPYATFGENLEKAPSPFKEWFNNYLKNININNKNIKVIKNLLKIDENVHEYNLIKQIKYKITQHRLFPIWFQNINKTINHTPDQTPNEINDGFLKRNSKNPHTLSFDNIILDKKEEAYSTHGIATPELTGIPTPTRPKAQKNWRDFSIYEVALAFRNHGFPMEALKYPITPLGLHFTLIHFDIPTNLSSDNYIITIGGCVNNPFSISLDELKKGPVIDQVVTMQCAGVGRGLVNPRPVYVPWSNECVGTYKWTGIPLKYILEKAGLLNDAVEIVFTGHDVGVDLGVEHAYEKAISIDEALNGDVMICWAHNDVPLLPQHGFPLRIIVPRYYGSYSVKWLRAITVINTKFEGVQQNVYTQKRSVDGVDKGVHFKNKMVDSLILPPGISDLLTRHRFLAPGKTILTGAAWSGFNTIKKVEISVDNLQTWQDAKLIYNFKDKYAWVHWEYNWNPIKEGDYIIASRAYDMDGNVQFLNPEYDWNRTGMGITSVERLIITVKNNIGISEKYIPTNAQLIIKDAVVPEPVNEMKLAKSIHYPNIKLKIYKHKKTRKNKW